MEERRLDLQQTRGVDRVVVLHRLALLGPAVALERGERRERRLVALLHQHVVVDGGDRVGELALQLREAERAAAAVVHRHADEGALAQQHDVLALGVLVQRVLPRLRHARRAEDAAELVHVEELAAGERRLLGGEAAGAQRGVHVEERVDRHRRAVDVPDARVPTPERRAVELGRHAEPVDRDRHRRPRPQVRELLSTGHRSVAHRRRPPLEHRLQRRALAALRQERAHHALGVLVLGVREERPRRLAVPLERRRGAGSGSGSFDWWENQSAAGLVAGGDLLVGHLRNSEARGGA